jgi:hypothetical protein
MPQISVTNELALAGLLRTFTPYDFETARLSPNEASPEKPTLGFAYNSSSGDNGSTNEGQYNTSYNNRYDIPMKLMKGTPPTQSQLNAGFVDRNSDVLVTLKPQSTINPNMWVNDGVNPSIYLQSTDLAIATASGTATWLWWHTFGVSGGYSTFIQAIFTVGLLGSGSDFEMPTTDIVSGRGYKLINGPRLTMATEFNYSYVFSYTRPA